MNELLVKDDKPSRGVLPFIVRMEDRDLGWLEELRTLRGIIPRKIKPKRKKTKKKLYIPDEVRVKMELLGLKIEDLG